MWLTRLAQAASQLLASEARKPFYVVSELLKFDPETLSGGCEKIEQRNPAEVWTEAPPKLTVRNPAFDVTPNRYIHGIVCEEGIIPPQTVLGGYAQTVPMGFPINFFLELATAKSMVTNNKTNAHMENSGTVGVGLSSVASLEDGVIGGEVGGGAT